MGLLPHKEKLSPRQVMLGCRAGKDVIGLARIARGNRSCDIADGMWPEGLLAAHASLLAALLRLAA